MDKESEAKDIEQNDAPESKEAEAAPAAPSEPEAPQERVEVWRRLLFAGLSGAIVCFIILLARHLLIVDPYFGMNVVFLVPPGALFGLLIACAAIWLPKKKPLRVTVLVAVPLCLGIGAALVSVHRELPLEPEFMSKFQLDKITGSVLADVLREMGHPGHAARAQRTPYIRPVTRGFTVALAVATCIICIGMVKCSSFRKRALVYPIGLCAILLARLLIPPAVLLTWPSAATCKSALGSGSWLVVFVWALAVDGGQMFGGSRLVARHTPAILGGFILAFGAATIVFCKPIAAEYYFFKAQHTYRSGDSSKGPMMYADLKKAYSLNPDNERNAYHYASFIATDMALPLARRHEDDAALRGVAIAILIFPKDPANHRTLAEVYEQMGQADKALTYYRTALEVARHRTPEDYRRWLSLGRGASSYAESLIDALSREGGSKSVEEILAFLADEDKEVVAHAATALGDVGAKEAVTPLKNLLDTHSSEAVTRAARRALEKLEGKTGP